MLQFAAALLLILAVTAIYHRMLIVNATTVALTYLLAILVIFTVWGIAVSAVMSVVAMILFNFYFLPPTGKLTVADPQNWIALIAFLVVAVLASQLANRARLQANAASARRREIEKLYGFSRSLLESGNVMQLVNRIPAQIVDSFEVGGAAIYLAEKEKVCGSLPFAWGSGRPAASESPALQSRAKRSKRSPRSSPLQWSAPAPLSSSDRPKLPAKASNCAQRCLMP